MFSDEPWPGRLLMLALPLGTSCVQGEPGFAGVTETVTGPRFDAALMLTVTDSTMSALPAGTGAVIELQELQRNRERICPGAVTSNSACALGMIRTCDTRFRNLQISFCVVALNLFGQVRLGAESGAAGT